MMTLPVIDEEETLTVIKSFVQTYVENAKLDSVVLGLSGGIDSAVMAMICADVLGVDNTHCLFLPDTATPKGDLDDVEKLIKEYDLNVEQQDISSLVESFTDNCAFNPDRLTLANVKARLRMVLLYAFANEKKSLVCGTSNKSELLIGYFTKYGDGGVDLMPLGDVFKSDVFRLARFLKLPDSLVDKPPSAGLWKGQTDEKELRLNYHKLDLILWGLERRMDVERIAKECDVSVDDVRRIMHMRKCSQHKRRSALVPKIGLRTPGLDWRSPIQEG